MAKHGPPAQTLVACLAKQCVVNVESGVPVQVAEQVIHAGGEPDIAPSSSTKDNSVRLGNNIRSNKIPQELRDAWAELKKLPTTHKDMKLFVEELGNLKMKDVADSSFYARYKKCDRTRNT